MFGLMEVELVSPSYPQTQPGLSSHDLDHHYSISVLALHHADSALF